MILIFKLWLRYTNFTQIKVRFIYMNEKGFFSTEILLMKIMIPLDYSVCSMICMINADVFKISSIWNWLIWLLFLKEFKKKPTQLNWRCKASILIENIPSHLQKLWDFVIVFTCFSSRRLNSQQITHQIYLEIFIL